MEISCQPVEELADGFALAVAEFESEVGRRGSGLARAWGMEAGVDVEAGGAAAKRGRWGGSWSRTLGVEGLAVGGGDIGRVADDGVEGAGGRR